MIEENYDEWEGRTIPLETYNELLCENEELKNKISDLEDEKEYADKKIEMLNDLIEKMYKEIKCNDKLKKEVKK